MTKKYESRIFAIVILYANLGTKDLFIQIFYIFYLTNGKTYGDRGPSIKGTASLSTNVPYPSR